MQTPHTTAPIQYVHIHAMDLNLIPNELKWKKKLNSTPKLFFYLLLELWFFKFVTFWFERCLDFFRFCQEIFIQCVNRWWRKNDRVSFFLLCVVFFFFVFSFYEWMMKMMIKTTTFKNNNNGKTIEIHCTNTSSLNKIHHTTKLFRLKFKHFRFETIQTVQIAFQTKFSVFHSTWRNVSLFYFLVFCNSMRIFFIGVALTTNGIIWSWVDYWRFNVN